MSLRALLIGDIVGGPGRLLLTNKLAALREKLAVDFCVANAENASGGSGLTVANARAILAAGVLRARRSSSCLRVVEERDFSWLLLLGILPAIPTEGLV